MIEEESETSIDTDAQEIKIKMDSGINEISVVIATEQGPPGRDGEIAFNENIELIYQTSKL